MMVEEADDVARGQAAVHLNAVIAAGLAAGDDLGGDIGAFDAQRPAGKLGKVLEQEHADRVGLLAGGAGAAPEAQGADAAAVFNERRQELGAQQLKGAAVAKEAGLIDGHRLGDLAFEGVVALEAQQLNELFKVREAAGAQQLGQAGIEKVVAGGIEDILRLVVDDLAQIGVVDAGGGGRLRLGGEGVGSRKSGERRHWIRPPILEAARLRAGSGR
jgi:hypothetical protein